MFCKNRTWATDSANYKVDPTLFDIFFDLTDRKFVPEQDLLPGHTSLRLSYLFRVQDFLAQCQQYSDEETNVAQDLLSKFQNYEIPVVTTYKRTKEEVGIIFERINNTGTKLTAFDLMIAWTWSEDFHLREEIDGILDVLDQKGFGDTDDKIVLQCLSAIINKTTRTKDILALDPDRVKESVSLLKDSLEKTIDFLSTELNVVTSDFLPQSHQLIPLTYFFFKVNNTSASQSKLLKQWFWRTAFSLRYSGAIDSRLNQDFALFDGIIAEEAVTLEKYQSLPPEKILIETPFTRTNVYTRSFLLLMAQSQPLNLTNGNKVDIGQALSKYNSKEYHHIFPKAFLVEKNVASQRINSICNFCFLPAYSNKRYRGVRPQTIFLIQSRRFFSIPS
jgi:hypothetical protein